MSTSRLYRLLLAAAERCAPLVGRWHPKLAAGESGRRDAVDHLLQWAEQHRDHTRPLVWLHAPSVGEGLQALAIHQALSARHPDWQYCYTYFSPSARALAVRSGADVAGFLPWDRPRHVQCLLDALAPDALVFVKLDLWPELATRAAARGIPVLLAAATVSPVSRRLRWPSRVLAAPGYAVVSAAGAVSPDDADRLTRLGVPKDRITVTGDPRADSVARVVAATPPEDPLLQVADRRTLVAGSTWPDDEAVLLAAFAMLRTRDPAARLVLVPHEPDAGAMAAIDARALTLGLPRPVRLSAPESAAAPLVVVDRVGVLARVYGGAGLAFVGGAFGRRGIHSVLEPAAWRLPVAFGPRWQASRDAKRLLKAGAATALPAAEPAEALTAWWSDLLQNDSARTDQGRRARQMVDEEIGAAERNAALIAAAVGRDRSRR